VPLKILDTADRVPAERGDAVVCIPLHSAHDEFVECLQSVLAHTPFDVRLLVADDATPDDRSLSFLQELDAAAVLEHAIYYVRSATNRGFVRTVNDAFDRASPADVVVVNSDCVVTGGWFESMTTAANHSTLVATVSVFTNHGTILSLPYRNNPQPLPQTMNLERAAQAVRSGSVRVYPRLPTVVGHCFYVKRAALDLVGPFDVAFSPGYGEEVDFSQRCVLHGLVHVAADDGFVLHKGSASFSADGAPNPVKELHDQMISVRYPYYDDWVRHFSNGVTSPFARALGAARRAFSGLTVSIDGRCLTPILTGTQLHTLEVIAALSREGGVRLRVAVPHDLGDYARTILEDLQNVAMLPAEEVHEGIERDDVVHRPFQVSSHEDLWFLPCLGERIVVTYQDLITFQNPGYFQSFEQWEAHRRLARHALSLADRVVFFSRVTAEEAISEELVGRGQTDVVYIGTDHTLEELPAVEEPPVSVAKLGERPFLLCLGTDFAHKNRAFALRVLAALRESHDWPGGLVFAGPHVPVGSSASEEAAFLALHPQLEDVVVDVAAIDEGKKRWLLHNAALMLYPSAHEGFGLVPFEAAETGLVCAFAAQTAMAELLPRSLALIEQWDPDATSDRIAAYLASERLRAEHVAAVRSAAAPLTWKRTARGLIEVYSAAARSRATDARKLVEEFVGERRDLETTREELQRAREELERFSELEKEYAGFRETFDQTAEELVGPHGVIPADIRRPLLAIGNRRVLRVPTFGVLRGLYRTGYRIRHRGRAPASQPALPTPDRSRDNPANASK
jgi:glycosyltransferase involved in cell wall biosynthesis/GT2 family glycosyltransferase